MNDLELYREQLALCDDKIIDALVERNSIIEKIMAYKEEYGMSIIQPKQEEKQERQLRLSWMATNTVKRLKMYSVVFAVTVSVFRQESF